MSNDSANLACRVCGKIQCEPPWGDDDQSPTFDICDCCGVEFGYGDCSVIATQASRERWLARGAVWRYPGEKPDNWSLEEQIKNIPLEYQ